MNDEWTEGIFLVSSFFLFKKECPPPPRPRFLPICLGRNWVLGCSWLGDSQQKSLGSNHLTVMPFCLGILSWYPEILQGPRITAFGTGWDVFESEKHPLKS